jgi:hypothetical protein
MGRVGTKRLTLLAAVLADLRLGALLDHVALLATATASHGRLLGALSSHVALLVAVVALHGRLVRAISSHVAVLVASAADHALHGARVGAVGLVVSVECIPISIHTVACHIWEDTHPVWPQLKQAPPPWPPSPASPLV